MASVVHQHLISFPQLLKVASKQDQSDSELFMGESEDKDSLLEQQPELPENDVAPVEPTIPDEDIVISEKSSEPVDDENLSKDSEVHQIPTFVQEVMKSKRKKVCDSAASHRKKRHSHQAKKKKKDAVEAEQGTDGSPEVEKKGDEG